MRAGHGRGPAGGVPHGVGGPPCRPQWFWALGTADAAQAGCAHCAQCVNLPRWGVVSEEQALLSARGTPPGDRVQVQRLLIRNQHKEKRLAPGLALPAQA